MLTEEQAIAIAADHSLSADVDEAHVYSFMDKNRVQLDLNDGDIVVITDEEDFTIEVK